MNLLFAFCQSQISFNQYKVIRKCLSYYAHNDKVGQEFSLVTRQILPSPKHLREQHQNLYDEHVRDSELTFLEDQEGVYPYKAF
jgi:hypothetical protein